jgi:hypothetical protein
VKRNREFSTVLMPICHFVADATEAENTKKLE